jgi:predicted RNA-binding Zn ribbon-like protein
VHDTLNDVDDLRALLGRHSSDGTAEAELSGDDVRDVREMRARLLEVFNAPDDRCTVAALNALLETPHHTLRLHNDAASTRWSWSAGFKRDATLAERLQVVTAVSLLGVIKALGPGRFRPCASPDCSGVFADTTRAGRRRYCQPAICGNRRNVAAYRARRAAQRQV